MTRIKTVRDEVAARTAAVVAAVRGRVTAAEIEDLVRRRQHRAQADRVAKRFVLAGAALGAMLGGGFAAWRWWCRQTRPEWLVEPDELADQRAAEDSAET